MMRRIRKFGRLLLYGGFGGLRPYESSVLEATAAALPPGDEQSLRRQIALIERSQRWNDDRMVIIGFADKDAVPKLAQEATDYSLASLRLKNASGTFKAKVMTHRGILSSLEFQPSPRRLTGREFSLSIEEMHAVDAPLSELFDDEEHPRTTAG